MTCSNTAQDLCLIKNPRSEAMQSCRCLRDRSLGVTAPGRTPGVGALLRSCTLSRGKDD